MESFTWQWIALGISTVVLLMGFVTGRNLSEKRKTIHIRRFGCLAFLPLLLAFLFPPPYVSSLSKTLSLENVSDRNLETDRNLATEVRDQAKHIDLLKEELESLRADLHEVNDHYQRMVQLVLTVGIVICLGYTMRKREVEDEVDKRPLSLIDPNE